LARPELVVLQGGADGTPVEPTWPDLIVRLLDRQPLSARETGWAMREIMRGDATPAQTAGFVVALRAKGELPEEVVGLVDVMLELAAPVEVPGRVVDTCGTGGDRSHTVNISTMAAIVVAGAGVPVAKHGGRAASSASGSADVLEALGVAVDLPADQIGPCLAEAGIAFCFAPVFHPGMRHAAVARRELGVGTVFNVLGPLTNPTRPAAQAMGVSDARLAVVMAGVLSARGTDFLVFRGDDGLDELTTTGTSMVLVSNAKGFEKTSFDPAVLGIARASVDDLRGGTAEENAGVARELLAGRTGAVRDAVLLNAAAAIAAYDAGTEPLEVRLAAGLSRAADAVDSGAAAEVLSRWVDVSQRLKST
jgi:anthranilate phosphoribosyltransferase